MELALFSVKKACTLHLTSFLLSALIKTMAMSQSAHRNLDSYKIPHRVVFGVTGVQNRTEIIMCQRTFAGMSSQIYLKKEI